MTDTAQDAIDDYIYSLKMRAFDPQDEEAEVELERLKDARHYNNTKRKLRTQHTAYETQGAAEQIKQYLHTLGHRHQFNDAMPTHRRLKISAEAVNALNSLSMIAIAVNQRVQITLDTVNSRETLHALTVRQGSPQYCLRITPGESDFYSNI